VALGEFQLIDRFFRDLGARRDDVPLGVGDDAALVRPPSGQSLAIAVDTLVEGVHFLPDDPPDSIGHRALAVNLSDLAAMGAEPAWFLLALTLATVDEPWLQRFAAGMGGLAKAHGVALIGGDTTSGRLTVSVTVVGFVPQALALRRDGARPGDAIYVSGTPGDAAAGLALRQGRLTAPPAGADRLLARFLWPTPRLELGLRLRGLASACIDVSDGLGGDLGKLCRASGVGAEIDSARLPLSDALRELLPGPRAAAFALRGGDDYELLFTAPPAACAAVESIDGAAAPRRIGTIVATPGVRCDGVALQGDSGHGFDHFGAG
jgi:thiamine-monophosphate kinase